MRPAAPSSEIDRVSALRGYDIPEGGSDALLDELTELAAAACGAPVALLSLVDRDRVWFKSQVGLDLVPVARGDWFCNQTVLGSDVFVVADAREDDRFASGSMVDTADGLRFYAGAPLLSADGVAFGALCVLDRIPRELSDDQELALRVLARQAVMQFELRRTREALTQSERRFQSIIEEANEAYISFAANGVIREWNRKAEHLLGWTRDEIIGSSVRETVVPADLWQRVVAALAEGNDGDETPLRTGSCFHLAPRQAHCIENSGTAPMRILGVFHPSGSPAIAYEEKQ